MRSRKRAQHAAERWPAWLDLSLVAAIVGVIVAIDVWDNARPLWLDEEMLGLNARHRTFTELAGPLWMNQSAPLGWLALQRLAIITFGTGELALRLVALAFGLGTLVVAVWAGRRWLRPPAAGLFVLLCAIGPWLAHFPPEAKHYSADTFWALLLPMLAMWVVESPHFREQIQRSRVWWCCAAVAHWFSNGGLLVAPAGAVVLLVGTWQHRRWRGLVEVTAGGLVLLASFAVHFMLSIRHTLANEYLQEFWSSGMLPSGLGVVGSLKWFAGQAGYLASNPIGTEKWALFWVTALIGCLAAPSRFPLILILVAASAVLLSGIRMVPLIERQALWIVPALYFAVASALHGSLDLARRGYRGRRAIHIGVAISMAALGALTAVDLIDRGWEGVQYRRNNVLSNRDLDDRTAVGWLLSQHRPGDAIVTTQFSLPSLWWYRRHRHSRSVGSRWSTSRWQSHLAQPPAGRGGAAPPGAGGGAARARRTPPPATAASPPSARPSAPSSEEIGRELGAHRGAPRRAGARAGRRPRRAPPPPTSGFDRRAGRGRGGQGRAREPAHRERRPAAGGWSCSTSGWRRTTARRRGSRPSSTRAGARSPPGARRPTRLDRPPRASSRRRSSAPSATSRRRSSSAPRPRRGCSPSRRGSTPSARRSSSSTSGSPRQRERRDGVRHEVEELRVDQARLGAGRRAPRADLPRGVRARAAGGRGDRRGRRPGGRDLAEREAELARSKAALERLGPVNVLAVQEHDEQEQRLRVPDRAARRRRELGREPARDHPRDQPGLERALPRHLRRGQPALRRGLRPPLPRRRGRDAPDGRGGRRWRAASRSSPARRASACRT